MASETSNWRRTRTEPCSEVSAIGAAASGMVGIILAEVRGKNIFGVGEELFAGSSHYQCVTWFGGAYAERLA